MDAASATVALARRVAAARTALGVADPVVWARRRGWDPDRNQRRILRSTSKRVILLCSRQFGKSTTAAMVAAHTAMTRPGSMILLVSRSERQSGELFSKVKTFVGSVRKSKDMAFEWRLANGSRIVAVPSSEETIRSFSAVDLLIEDEASRVPDTVYKSIRPMLAVSRGRLFLLSTPYGKRGHFYDAWTRMKGWDRYEIQATACPRIDQSFLDEEREELGEAWFDQEYMCRFIATDDAMFSDEEIARAFTEGIKPAALDAAQGVVTPLFGGG